MWTPWTITRLVRRRIKDWAMCFFVCRFPLDEEADTFCYSSTQVPGRSQETDEKLSSNSRLKQEGESIRSSTRAISTELAEKGSDDSSWPRFADEDYIVFCFREDGAIHVVKDGKSESFDHVNRSSSRPVNRKFIYGENAEKVHDSSQKDMSGQDGKGKGKRNIYLDTQLPPDEIRGGNCIKDTKECKFVTESSGSNQSDSSSASSFAFPVLRWEWTGSPVKMPKSEGQHSRKNKGRSVRLYCCRF
ncbi:hypothetical protein F0562_023742 [Nyssa sinensis]|uniref:Protein BREAKING OF ASYMMETRY IN THE STOMATAL LINEAGE n=1 Tax=Nyssa sinensis TaxID=561372 RepID=A0A5J5BK06_9ASTE|nr:hypothetical protein F0562_023742 [Nyssa sinensis]